MIHRRKATVAVDIPNLPVFLGLVIWMVATLELPLTFYASPKPVKEKLGKILCAAPVNSTPHHITISLNFNSLVYSADFYRER
jgi:hypothetical protein